MYKKNSIKALILLASLVFGFSASAEITKTDLKTTKIILNEIKLEKFGHAKYLIGELKNSAAKQVSFHALYRSRGYVSHYREIAGFINRYPNWKGLSSLKSIIEKRIFRGQYDDFFAAKWYKTYPAKTSAGKLYLAEQYFRKGNATQGLKVLRSVWRGYVLDSKTEALIMSKMGKYFDRWDHKLRADFLMNAGRSSAAIRSASYAGAAYKNLYLARAALEKNKKSAIGLYKKVAKSLKKDFGLQYSLVKYYRRQRDGLSALEIWYKTKCC